MPARYFYSLCIGFLLGIGLGTVGAVSYAGVLLIGMLGGIALMLDTKKRALFCIGIACVSGVIGMARGVYELQKDYTLLQYVGEDLARSGTIVAEPDVRMQGQVLTVRDTETQELLLVRIRSLEQRYVGDMLTYSGKLTVPEAFDTEQGRVFDYPKFLRARDVCCVIEEANVAMVAYEDMYKFEGVLVRFKLMLAETLVRIMPEPEVSLAKAMLLGMKRELDSDENRVFKNVGIVHVVVLSGMHIMFVFVIAVWCASLVFGYRTRYVVALLSVLTFALMVGFSPTVTRAVIMALFVGASFLLGREKVPMRALIVAAIALLLYNPLVLLYDPGFQLSFLATFAIIVVAPIFMEIFHRVPTTFKMREILAATIGIECLLLPLIAYSMGQFPTIGIVANLLVLPVVASAMGGAALLALTGMFLPVLAVTVAPPVTLLHTYIFSVATFLERIPYTHYRVPEFSAGVLLAVYLCIGMILFLLYRKYMCMPRTHESAHHGVDVRLYTIVPMKEFKLQLGIDYPERSS